MHRFKCLVEPIFYPLHGARDDITSSCPSAHIKSILVIPYDVVGAQATRWLASVFILYNNNLADFFTSFTFCTIPTWLIFTFLRRNSNTQTSCFANFAINPLLSRAAPPPLGPKSMTFHLLPPPHLTHRPVHVLKVMTYILTHIV